MDSHSMERSNIIKSYAKINLHLEVLNRREDNYHNLFSLMAELELHDLLKLEDYYISDKTGDVSVEILNKGGEFSSVLSGIPAEKNFITIAVKKYLSELKKSGTFVFSIIKNIPSGAGLGGGSSNAASALKILSEKTSFNTDKELLKAASATGSDVPFFLKGGFAFVEGRGESVVPVNFNDESCMLLVNNGIHVNTGYAYESLKKPLSAEIIDCSGREASILNGIALKPRWKKLFRNDFEESIFGLYPQIGLIKENMYKNGAFFASMTGSGSTVFGLFSDENSAQNARKVLENDGNRVYYTNFRRNKN